MREKKSSKGKREGGIYVQPGINEEYFNGGPTRRPTAILCNMFVLFMETGPPRKGLGKGPDPPLLF